MPNIKADSPLSLSNFNLYNGMRRDSEPSNSSTTKWINNHTKLNQYNMNRLNVSIGMLGYEVFGRHMYGTLGQSVYCLNQQIFGNNRTTAFTHENETARVTAQNNINSASVDNIYDRNLHVVNRLFNANVNHKTGDVEYSVNQLDTQKFYDGVFTRDAYDNYTFSDDSNYTLSDYNGLLNGKSYSGSSLSKTDGLLQYTTGRINFLAEWLSSNTYVHRMEGIWNDTKEEYILKWDDGTVDIHSSLHRASNKPIDDTEVFDDIEEANEYATKEDTTAYGGQVCSVQEDNGTWRPVAVQGVDGVRKIAFADEIGISAGIDGNNVFVIRQGLSTMTSSPVIKADTDSGGLKRLLSEATKMHNFSIVLQRNLPQRDGHRVKYSILHGIPYSSPRLNDGLVPNQTSIHTLKTALAHPYSRIYTSVYLHNKSSKDESMLTDSYYGTVCSALTSYLYNLKYPYTSTQLYNYDDNEISWLFHNSNNDTYTTYSANIVTVYDPKAASGDISILGHPEDGIMLGDIIVRKKDVDNGISGHVKIITDIEYDTETTLNQGQNESRQVLRNVTTTEAMNPEVKTNTYNRSRFEKMIQKNNGAYKIIRFVDSLEPSVPSHLESIEYSHLRAEQDYDINYTNFLLDHPIIPSKGDRSNWNIDNEDIEFSYSGEYSVDVLSSFKLEKEDGADWVEQGVKFKYIPFPETDTDSHLYGLENKLNPGKYRVKQEGHEFSYFIVDSLEEGGHCTYDSENNQYTIDTTSSMGKVLGVVEMDSLGEVVSEIDEDDGGKYTPQNTNTSVNVIVKTTYGVMTFPLGETPVYTKGDVNGDSLVDYRDLYALTNLINTERTSENGSSWDAANIHENDYITSYDYSRLETLLGGGFE